jgi:hypothetical protein
MRRMLYSGRSKKPVLSSIFMRISGAAHTVAVARQADVAFGVHLVRVLPIGQAIALQDRIPLAQFDAAVGDHLDIVLSGDMIGGTMKVGSSSPGCLR